MIMTRSIDRHRPRHRPALALAAVLLAGCAVEPEPLTLAAIETQRDQDRALLFADQEPVGGPISLHEAMARAIRYNLDHRLRLMDQALALRQLDVANYAMLPRLTAAAGYEGRSNQSGSSSRSLLTGDQSLEVSTSQDRNRFVSDITLTWNVLDFGLSYVRARQQADRSLIAGERRRKAIHIIIQEVRSAYWRAVAAERLLGRIDPLIARVDRALDDARQIERRQLRAPIEALTYQRTLLESLSQLQLLRRQLILARTQLAALMNLPPGQGYTLAEQSAADYRLPEITLPIAELEALALVHRPELREEAYQARIGAHEADAALLQLLPGINLNVGYNYDSNSFLFNQDWASYGTRIVGNLISVVTGPTALRAAEAQQEVDRARRLALSMAVITQVRLAMLELQQARQEFAVADELNAVDERILGQLSAAAQTQRTGDLDLILGELNAVYASLRRDFAYAEVQNAAGRLFTSVAADPLPAALPAEDIATVAAAIRETEAGWYAGRLVPPETPQTVAAPGS